jgi:hypothetical protein
MADLRLGQIGAGMRERIGRHARGKMALGKAVGITSVQVQRGGVTGIGIAQLAGEQRKGAIEVSGAALHHSASAAGVQWRSGGAVSGTEIRLRQQAVARQERDGERLFQRIAQRAVARLMEVPMPHGEFHRRVDRAERTAQHGHAAPMRGARRGPGQPRADIGLAIAAGNDHRVEIGRVPAAALLPHHLHAIGPGKNVLHFGMAVQRVAHGPASGVIRRPSWSA